MGGSSKQTTGYKYFSNFLLFIGNPIEKVLGINFDKRGWQTPLIDEEKNPLAIGDVNLPNLYGENEGGVAGKIHARYGTANPQPVDFYVDHLSKNDLPALSYPFQSYLAFKDFYLGNSGYMKEMLLWVKRIHVRNDGREQWYEVRGDGAVVCEIGAYSFNSDSNEFLYKGPFRVECVTKVSPQNESEENFYSEYNYTGIFNESDLVGGGWHIGSADTDLVRSKSPINYSLIYSFPGFDGTANIVFRVSNYFEKNDWQIIGTLAEEYRQETGTDGMVYIYCKFFVPKGGICRVGLKGTRKVDEEGLTGFGVTVMARMYECFTRPDSTSVEALDINVIHKIREILTDDTAMGKPESDVNDVNFRKAADRIWDEGLGISWSITEKSCLEAIEELCGHIEAGVRVNRQTGLYEMVLFRDDWFDENEIHTLAVNKIKSMSLEVANADEAINQLNVSYYNRDAIKDSSFSIAENASIRNLNGRVNAEDADFPYFMNQRNAAVVAQWKLKQMSSPVWKGTFTTAEYNARKWNRYDLLKLSWPRKWQGEITVRIMKINLGTGADVSIDFVEVVPYSSELSSNIVIDTPIDISPLPPQPCQYEPFELPYYLAVMALGQRQVDEELSYENNFGLVGVVAEQPQSNSLYAVMMTHDGTEGEEWVRAATINYEPAVDIDQNISRTSTNFTVKDSTVISELPVGTLIKCGSDWIGTSGEWMVFQGVDVYTGVVSVKRGALDSLPQNWGANTKLYFCGNDVAFDSNEYVVGEKVLVSALTTTPSGMLENKGSIGVEMNARAIRPYPPANVRVNGRYWPAYIENDLVITWVNRNRVQQTGGNILGWFDEGVMLEPNTQTLLTVTELDIDDVVLATHRVNVTGTNTFTLLEANMQAGVDSIQIVLKTVRDEYECLNILNHTVMISNLIAPADVIFEVIEL